MESKENKNIIINSPVPVTINEMKKIITQMEKGICQIGTEKNICTGFFCSISYNNKQFKFLLTSNKINEELKDNYIIRVSIQDGKEIKIIHLKNKKIYTSKKYGITIIEINSEIDKIDEYLEIDENIFDEKFKNTKNIYMLQYSKDNKSSVSYGILDNIKNQYNIIHHCYIKNGSLGSPILNLSNKKVIGINIENRKKYKFNKGIFIKYPINEYLNINERKEVNIIKMEIKISKEDINKHIYFLDNSYRRDHLKELNESNVELYINNKKYKYQKYFKPEKEGIYIIKIKLKDNIKDCSFMFEGKNIENIDLSSFDTKNITNMSNMFNGCSNLMKLDLSSFNTKNVTNMSFMFNGCSNLEKLDISSFDTKNVTNMSNMFECCSNLKNLHLSSFDTKKVKNMSYMLSCCSNLKNLDLSSFDTKNVANMSSMLSVCYNFTIFAFLHSFLLYCIVFFHFHIVFFFFHLLRIVSIFFVLVSIQYLDIFLP